MKHNRLFSLLAALIGFASGYHLAPTFPQLSPRLDLVLKLGCAVFGAIVGMASVIWWFEKVLQHLRESGNTINTKQLISGSLGGLAGLLAGQLFSHSLARLPLPFGMWLPVLVSTGMAWLGWSLFIDKLAPLAWKQNLRYVLAGLRSSDIHTQSQPDTLTQPMPHRPPDVSPYEANQILLDTSVIIDGRIADICKTGFIRSKVLVPRFVLQELQYISDSPEAMRRQRGRRGLEALNRLQKDTEIPVHIVDLDVPNVREVDSKLIALGKQLRCPVVTNDYNLNRVAEIQGVTVLNINELANAVKAVVLPGETINLQIIQEGKEHSQGIGYLDDGTMVVVEDGMRHINAFVDVTVTKILQTNAGRMVFARRER